MKKMAVKAQPPTTRKTVKSSSGTLKNAATVVKGSSPLRAARK